MPLNLRETKQKCSVHRKRPQPDKGETFLLPYTFVTASTSAAPTKVERRKKKKEDERRRKKKKEEERRRKKKEESRPVKYARIAGSPVGSRLLGSFTSLFCVQVGAGASRVLTVRGVKWAFALWFSVEILPIAIRSLPDEAATCCQEDIAVRWVGGYQ